MPRAKAKSPAPRAKRTAPRASRCTCCALDEEWKLSLLRAGGASLDSLAKLFGVHRSAIHRHWNRCVSPERKAGYLAGPVQIQEAAAKAAESGSSVLDTLNAARVVIMGQMALLQDAGDARGVAIFLGRLHENQSLVARVTGELSSLAANTINIQNNVVLTESPAFLRMQAAVLQALAPFPDARRAVIAALRQPDEPAMKVIDAR